MYTTLHRVSPLRGPCEKSNECASAQSPDAKSSDVSENPFVVLTEENRLYPLILKCVLLITIYPLEKKKKSKLIFPERRHAALLFKTNAKSKGIYLTLEKATSWELSRLS